MGQYDLFRKISKSNLTEKQRTVNEMQNDIINDFLSSPSYESIKINSFTTSIDSHIIEYSRTQKYDDLKTILIKPGSTISAGDDILWGTEHWLCLSADNPGGVYWKGTMQRCNSTLTLVTSTVETITGYGTSGRPIITKTNTTTTWNCIVETKVFSADMNSQINLPKGEIKVTIPYSALVLEGMEFSMWGNDYKITGLDLSKVISSVGVLSISAEKVVI